MRPIAIFNAGPLRDHDDGLFDACGGDNGVLFAKALGLGADQVTDIDLKAGAPLPEPGAIGGVIVTGSAAMVTDRHDWAERAADWIRRNRDRVPILGVCFGHQLVAHALGGAVEVLPGGAEYGTVSIECASAAAVDPLFDGLPVRFSAQAAHAQYVSQLPTGGVALAHNGHGLQAARFSDRTWGVQFHPEYDLDLNRVLIRGYGEYIAGLGLDPDMLEADLAPTPEPMKVMRSFARLVAQYQTETA